MDVIKYFLTTGAPSIIAWCVLLGVIITLFLWEAH